MREKKNMFQGIINKTEVKGDNCNLVINNIVYNMYMYTFHTDEVHLKSVRDQQLYKNRQRNKNLALSVFIFRVCPSLCCTCM